ncbi:hypothetical protein OIE68_04315 [Nocardia vinacea]|uniref:hypothetical protein n=1 Tax=Nocardia vinacea TaxID=96468 RepID=UPI002E11AF01|nr:hypothetical protein OIE68_04315 [Nocardia vinacea]
MTVPSRRRATDLRLAVAGVLLIMLCALATGSAALTRVDRVLGTRLPGDGSIGPDPGAVRPWSRRGLGQDSAVAPTKDRRR